MSEVHEIENTPRQTSTLVVEDNDDVANVLEHIIGNEQGMTCSGRLSSAEALLQTIAEKTPDIVLMDLTMPGPSPLEAMAAATAKYEKTRFIIFSGYDDPKRIDEIFRSGASGFLSKRVEIPAILDAIRAVAAGRLHLNLAYR
jgi:DNA-binding NarL/FixJ family response regulator